MRYSNNEEKIKVKRLKRRLIYVKQDKGQNKKSIENKHLRSCLSHQNHRM